MQKEFQGCVFKRERYSNFRKKGDTKLSFRIGKFFAVIFSFGNCFFIFLQPSHMFTITGQNMTDI